MEISPKRIESIKTVLSLFMSKDEAERFIDIAYSTNLIKQGQLCWQALVSISLHVAELYTHAETSAENTILQELVHEALQPLEALLGSLVLKPREESLEDEQSHILFHTRFALGFVLLANGDKQRSKSMLHEMAATKISLRGGDFRSGPGILGYMRDIGRGKWSTALYLLPELHRQEDYGEMLYLITEAVACNPWSTLMTELAPVVLDTWAAKCEQEDANKEYDFPSLEWLDLFAEAAEILLVCQEADSEGALPSDCKRESAQFLAWKFGQIVGGFAIPDNQWHDDPFDHFWELSDATDDESFVFQRGKENTYQALKAVVSLLCEHDPSRDLNKVHKRYVSMWRTSYSYSGMPLADIGSGTDLYWAMRIGFLDKVLETTEQRALIEFETPPLIRDIAMTKDIASTIALRQIKQQQTLDRIVERLPPSKQEVLAFLEQQLCSVWHKLPSDVADKLVEAEQIYKIGTWPPSATISFAQAVETCFRYYFVNPFIDYMREEGLGEVTLVMGLRGEARPIRVGIRSSRESRVTGLSYLSLQQWAGLFGMLVDPSQKGTINLPIKMLIKQKWPKLDMADLKGLVQPLGEVQRYRNNAVHGESSRPYNEERNELEQMRNLVLGIDGPSVIMLIFQLLGAKK